MELATAGLIAQGVGTLTSAGAAIQQGEYDQDAYNYHASKARLQSAQAEERSDEEFAAASRRAFEIGREYDTIKSRVRAVGGAQGGGMFGDVSRTIAEFRGIGLQESLTTLKEGVSRAKQYKKQAQALNVDARNLEYQGDVAKDVGQQKAVASILTGGATILSGIDYGSSTSTVTPARRVKPREPSHLIGPGGHR